MKSKYFKLFLLLIFISTALTSYEQNKVLIISSAGVDSLKIGLSTKGVEKIIGVKLTNRYYNDTLVQMPFSQFNQSPFNDVYKEVYQGIELLFTFHHGELLGIALIDNSKFVQTKAGIKIGMTKGEFDKICLDNNYYCSYSANKTGCFFYENADKSGSLARLFVKFDNSVISGICTIQMEHD